MGRETGVRRGPRARSRRKGRVACRHDRQARRPQPSRWSTRPRSPAQPLNAFSSASSARARRTRKRKRLPPAPQQRRMPTVNSILLAMSGPVGYCSSCTFRRAGSNGAMSCIKLCSSLSFIWAAANCCRRTELQWQRGVRRGQVWPLVLLAAAGARPPNRCTRRAAPSRLAWRRLRLFSDYDDRALVGFG